MKKLLFGFLILLTTGCTKEIHHYPEPEPEVPVAPLYLNTNINDVYFPLNSTEKTLSVYTNGMWEVAINYGGFVTDIGNKYMEGNYTLTIKSIYLAFNFPIFAEMTITYWNPGDKENSQTKIITVTQAADPNGPGEVEI